MPLRRLAHGCAVTLLALALVAPAASGNTITTIAGGGSLTPPTYGASSEFIDPLTLSLPSPGGVAWSGDPKGLMYVVSSQTCALYWYDPDPTSGDYGFYVEGGTLGDCNPSAGGYATLDDAHAVRLNHPCCVTSDQRFDHADTSNTAIGPYVASTGSGRIERYQWFGNEGQTLAGGTSDCGTAPPTSGDPATKQFCTITAVARQYNSPYDYAFGETGRGTSPGNLYWVSGNAIVAEQGVLNSDDSLAAFAFNRNGALVSSNGRGALWAYGCCPFAGGSPFAGARNTTGYLDATPATNARFDGAKGVTVAFDGSIYVADANNCRIRRISSMSALATVSTIAGHTCAVTAALGDGGDAADANFDHPTGVAFAPTGLVVSDTGHNRLRLIDRTSIVGAPSMTDDSTPTFDIRSLDSPSHLLCTLDDADVDCSNLGTVIDGQHTLKAWENGNAADPPDPPDPTPAVHTFKVDTHAPTGVALRSPGAGATGVPVDGDYSWDAGTDAVTGIDHYELWIDGTKNRDVATSACADGVCVAKTAQAVSEGDHDWQIVALDAVGHALATERRPFQAGGPPGAAFAISPNPALVNRPVTFDARASTDESGIAQYEWDLDGDGSFETNGGPTVTKTYAAPATVAVRLRVTDGVGKQSTTDTQSLRITNQAAAQSLIGISINNGAQYTNNPNVKLLIKAPATASAVLVSNDGGFLAPSTFPIASTVDWRLDSSGPERLPKTVYAKFMLGPIISDNFTDDIILDERPPVVQQASLTSASSARVAAAAKAKTYTVKVKAKDSNSGVGKVQVTANKRKPGKLLPYKTKLKVKAPKPKFVRAQDRAGNFSAWKKLR